MRLKPQKPELPGEAARRLEQLYDDLLSLNSASIGYPCSQAFDYTELLPFLKLAMNNVGDPFEGSNYRQNTHVIEREVLEIFAGLTDADPENYWGYVTNGGTEGNMYGLYLAREIYPDGICYFSEDCHYSVPKILRLQHTRNIMIRSQNNGEMDYKDLHATLRLHRDVPPILFVNVGTTMKGAIDQLETIHEILHDLAISEYYIHADAALSGLILPFIDRPPAWNFSAGIDSIAVSGHKFIGCPLPCGIVMAKKHHVDRVARSVEYVGVLDTTISGSRNAITPLMLWTAFQKYGLDHFRDVANRCLDCARYAVRQMNAANIPAWRNQNSITVVFPRPPEALFEKWMIAPHHSIGHLITMPQVTYETVDAFIEEYLAAKEGSVE